MPAAPSPRQSSTDRREQVITAAIREFGEQGYRAASTASIAKRAGISQPYIYALFPSKRDLFLAVHDKVIQRVRDTFERAARACPGATPHEILACMGMTYAGLIADRHSLLVQLQCYAAAGDPDIGAHVSASFQGLVDHVTSLSRASPSEVAEFVAAGMLANVTTLLNLPGVCAPLWEGESAQ